MADYYVRLDDIEKGFAVFCENVNLLYQQPPQIKREMWEFLKQLILSQSLGEDFVPSPQDVIDISVSKKEETEVKDIVVENGVDNQGRLESDC